MHAVYLLDLLGSSYLDMSMKAGTANLCRSFTERTAVPTKICDGSLLRCWFLFCETQKTAQVFNGRSLCNSCVQHVQIYTKVKRIAFCYTVLYLLHLTSIPSLLICYRFLVYELHVEILVNPNFGKVTVCYDNVILPGLAKTQKKLKQLAQPFVALATV